jgi:hypothetical protein
VLGVEAAGNVADIAKQAGAPTWNRLFNETCARDILAQHGPAKLVTAAGVFFHLEERHSVVRAIAALLAEKAYSSCRRSNSAAWSRRPPSTRSTTSTSATTR